MQIIENATIYKCDHCNYTDTVLGRMKSHENECLNKQLKANKNEDKRKIYNLLDIDIINIKIKDFLEKYNLPVSTDIEFVRITVHPSFAVSLLIDKSVRGIFDATKFFLHTALRELTYSNLENISNDETREIDKNILLKESEIAMLRNKKQELILNNIKDYLKLKDNV